MPALQKYQKKLRVLRNVQKAIEDMQSTEDQWKDLPYASHNKEQLKRWKLQLKRLAKSRSCAEAGILDPILLKRALTFYSSAAAVLLGLLTSNDINVTMPKLPLYDIPTVFTALPEWYIEDIAEFILLALQ